MAKLLVLALFFLIVASLGSALWHMMRTRDDPKRMARALTVRIGLSLGLFALLYVLYFLGYIQPHGLIPATP